jgi:HSP20 family molecular chaperone IbpA
MADAVKEMEKREAEAQAGGVERTRARKAFNAAVDIIEKKDRIVVIADLPGVDENSLDVTLEKDVLSIYGKVDAGVPEGRKPVYSEYAPGDYQRTFTLADSVDREKIKATVKNGVLRLVLPKAEAARTRKIDVKAE